MSDACPNCATLTQALSECIDEVARRDAALRLALGIAVDAEAMVHRFRALSEIIADLFAGSVHERPTQSELPVAGDTERPGPPEGALLAAFADPKTREEMRALAERTGGAFVPGPDHMQPYGDSITYARDPVAEAKAEEANASMREVMRGMAEASLQSAIAMVGMACAGVDDDEPAVGDGEIVAEVRP